MQALQVVQGMTVQFQAGLGPYNPAAGFGSPQCQHRVVGPRPVGAPVYVTPSMVAAQDLPMGQAKSAPGVMQPATSLGAGTVPVAAATVLDGPCSTPGVRRVRCGVNFLPGDMKEDGHHRQPALPFTRSASSPALPFTRSGMLRALPIGSGPDGRMDDSELTREAQNIFHRIVGSSSSADTMCRLQFIRALMNDRTVAAFALPGVDCAALMSDEDAYESAHFLFNYMSRGRRRVRFNEFLANFQNTKASVCSNTAELRYIFDLLDVNGDNHISRHELLMAVKSNQTIYDFMLRDADVGMDGGAEDVSNAVDDVYKALCGDSKFFDFADFVAYFRSIARVSSCGLHTPIERYSKRVLIIGPGFGTQTNPLQTQVVMRAGFQFQWCHDVPNPEEATCALLSHVQRIREQINQAQPDLLVCGSTGGAYAVALWQNGYWRGPTVLINAHPTCRELPPNVPIVLCHGDQDPHYQRPRAELEKLITTGSPNMCFLFYSSSSGRLPTGHTPRPGDQHSMASLVQYDCLPRLMDSALCREGPEMHMARTWPERLPHDRREAERFLGLTPYKLRQFWVSPQRKTVDKKEHLFDVPLNSAEFRMVTAAFRSSAMDPSAYGPMARENWSRMRLIRIQRIENTMQQDGGIQAYYNSVRSSFESMNIEFVPGVHTRWLFHGSRDTDSIVSNPIQGFQPLASGSAGSSVWGRGTYFARDAEYVASGPFCGAPAPDGSRRMLMCLVTTGMSCAGDPNHNGILPMRLEPHRYNSTVDSLSSPEIYIVQHPGAAYPAYVITFLS